MRHLMMMWLGLSVFGSACRDADCQGDNCGDPVPLPSFTTETLETVEELIEFNTGGVLFTGSIAWDGFRATTFTDDTVTYTSEYRLLVFTESWTIEFDDVDNYCYIRLLLDEGELRTGPMGNNPWGWDWNPSDDSIVNECEGFDIDSNASHPFGNSSVLEIFTETPSGRWADLYVAIGDPAPARELEGNEVGCGIGLPDQRLKAPGGGALTHQNDCIATGFALDDEGSPLRKDRDLVEIPADEVIVEGELSPGYYFYGSFGLAL
ncbi:MAG: hypothetical protein AAGA48_20545 [Myxococcota bacterium]